MSNFDSENQPEIWFELMESLTDPKDRKNIETKLLSGVTNIKELMNGESEETYKKVRSFLIDKYGKPKSKMSDPEYFTILDVMDLLQQPNESIKKFAEILKKMSYRMAQLNN